MLLLNILVKISPNLMEKVPVEYVILCFQISQGFVDFIHEVAVFDSYEVVKKHWDENPKKYSAEGHA